MMANQQALMTDSQKHGAEDEDQLALPLDDQKCGDADGWPTGGGPRRSDAWRRRCGISSG